MMRVLEPNVGVLDCYEALEVPEAEDLAAEHGFVLSADPSVEVERLNWGEIVVRTAAPTNVRFNFNHHRNWRVVESDGAAKVVSENRKPLELAISNGTFARIKYQVPAWPPRAKVTLVARALALLCGAACLVRRRQALLQAREPD